ncbi:hypothetical protein WN51_14098 [Melipona quadrifasciata]|uniref:Uncharacterized protein n=1 Tax=Melipona quadrifasciata TaxID=166423 RepID=A0A0N0BFY4_9HYME|nr:hypothetical protein WN51_14098 [Melipona quadrifasciata]
MNEEAGRIYAAIQHIMNNRSKTVRASGPEWANGSSIWNSRSKLSRWSVLEIDVMSARTGQDTGPYYAYHYAILNFTTTSPLVDDTHSILYRSWLFSE